MSARQTPPKGLALGVGFALLSGLATWVGGVWPSPSGKAERRFPARAELESRFRAGVFVEEREAIAIDALTRAGQKTAAQRRGQAFLRRFPGSAYRRRVAALLGAH